MRNALCTVAILLAACTTPPRTSTPEERQAAETAIAFVETGITVAYAAGKLDAAKFALATQQIAEIREAISNSETEPVSVATLVQRITNLAIAWSVPQPKQP